MIRTLLVDFRSTRDPRGPRLPGPNPPRPRRILHLPRLGPPPADPSAFGTSGPGRVVGVSHIGIFIREHSKAYQLTCPVVGLEKVAAYGALIPNPPKDTDGRREDSGRGWVEGATGEMSWGLGVDGRPAEGLQSPHRAPKALCGSCDARDGERIRSRGLSRPGWREIAGTLGQLQGWPSGREWNGLQPGQGATELGFPRPAPGRCKVRRRAERVIRPTRAKTRRLRVLVVTIC